MKLYVKEINIISTDESLSVFQILKRLLYNEYYVKDNVLGSVFS